VEGESLLSALDQSALADLLRPFLDEPLGISGNLTDEAVPPGLYSSLTTYLDLLMKWNERVSLTSIRSPEAIVRRHFGESLFLARHLPSNGTLLDFGSGAGFPGVPIQLLRPELRVTLAESQGKKASFLREVVRTLLLPSAVWAGRVEDRATAGQFDVITLRAVDLMNSALQAAADLRPREIWIIGSESTMESLAGLASYSITAQSRIPHDTRTLVARAEQA
jgi:16S rRNA (guanine527-N7)-methyltransferase